MMQVSTWHILNTDEADRHAIPEKVQSYFIEHCYDLGKANRPPGVTCLEVLLEKMSFLRL
ncbi:MAG: hypothetical protein DWQ07_15410 [Chloroflexi bacterium]|nr:MAG: hypothetical protein DWQ07_15410 [Chloroflexota bacterium]